MHKKVSKVLSIEWFDIKVLGCLPRHFLGAQKQAIVMGGNNGKMAIKSQRLTQKNKLTLKK